MANISLVIPAYNEEKYLKECLECVVKQKDYFQEIIVVDNASTDNTLVVAHSFPFVKVIVEKKKGASHARQRGYLEATGDIIAFVDADTRMPSGWAERVKKEFEQDTQVVCLSGPYLYYDQPIILQLLTKYVYWYCIGLLTYYIVGYMALGGNVVIRKKVLDAMGGWDTTINFYGDDTDISRRATAYGKMKFLINFVMPASSRRLKGQGTLKTTYLYVKNYLSQVIFKRPATKESLDIR